MLVTFKPQKSLRNLLYNAVPCVAIDLQLCMFYNPWHHKSEIAATSRPKPFKRSFCRWSQLAVDQDLAEATFSPHGSLWVVWAAWEHYEKNNRDSKYNNFHLKGNGFSTGGAGVILRGEERNVELVWTCTVWRCEYVSWVRWRPSLCLWGLGSCWRTPTGKKRICVVWCKYSVCKAVAGIHPDFDRTVRDRGFKKLKKWLKKTPDLGRQDCDYSWYKRVLPAEQIRFRNISSQLSMLVLMSCTLHELAGLNTWKSGKVCTLQCGWLTRDQFSRTVLDLWELQIFWISSNKPAGKLFEEWPPRQHDLITKHDETCANWNLKQELSVHIALLLNEVPQDRSDGRHGRRKYRVNMIWICRFLNL